MCSSKVAVNWVHWLAGTRRADSLAMRTTNTTRRSCCALGCPPPELWLAVYWSTFTGWAHLLPWWTQHVADATLSAFGWPVVNLQRKYINGTKTTRLTSDEEYYTYSHRPCCQEDQRQRPKYVHLTQNLWQEVEMVKRYECKRMKSTLQYTCNMAGST